jgi:hypothetical protein
VSKRERAEVESDSEYVRTCLYVRDRTHVCMHATHAGKERLELLRQRQQVLADLKWSGTDGEGDRESACVRLTAERGLKEKTAFCSRQAAGVSEHGGCIKLTHTPW